MGGGGGGGYFHLRVCLWNLFIIKTLASLKCFHISLTAPDEFKFVLCLARVSGL